MEHLFKIENEFFQSKKLTPHKHIENDEGELSVKDNLKQLNPKLFDSLNFNLVLKALMNYEKISFVIFVKKLQHI